MRWSEEDTGGAKRRAAEWREQRANKASNEGIKASNEWSKASNEGIKANKEVKRNCHVRLQLGRENVSVRDRAGRPAFDHGKRVCGRSERHSSGV